jgi:hypothetical protein
MRLAMEINEDGVQFCVSPMSRSANPVKVIASSNKI